MRNSAKEIVNKLIYKSKKQNFESTTSTLKSAFSFKNSNASKIKNKSINSKLSDKSSNHNNKNNTIEKKIFKQILEVLKMRLYIDSIMNFKDEEIKDIMNENIKLINLNDYDIQSINKFVDDFVEIIKEENKKQRQFKESKISLIENKQQNLNDANEFILNSTRRRTIQLNSNGYRPTSVVTQRRRTIEVFLEMPKGEIKNESMKFNLFEKSLKKNHSFYEGDPYSPENNKKYNCEGLEEFRNKIIEEFQSK